MDTNGGIRIKGVVQTPWILDDGGTYQNETIIELENVQAAIGGWFRIKCGDGEPYTAPAGAIAPGESAVSVLMRELREERETALFELFDNEEGRGPALASAQAELKRVRHWRIYVAHDMHTDVGYTDHPEDLIHTVYPAYLDEVLEYAEQTEGWERDDRFRYPVEASFMLYGSALAARSAEWLERLKKYLAQGRVTYPYDYVHLASEGAGTEEIARQCYISGRFLRDMLGAGPVRTFVHSDDAGLAWANVDALADAGCKYVSLRFQDANWNYADERLKRRNGVVPEGHCPKLPRLFYLRGRVPGNRLLTFDGPPYHFDDFGMRSDSPETTAELLSWNFMKRQTEDYPYDAYLLQLTKVRDNFNVDANVMRNIRAMNHRTDAKGRKYVFPRFFASNVEDFFDYVSGKYGSSIPSLQGTMESFWSFGAAQVAHESALNRRNHESVPASEFFSTAASALMPGRRYPYEDVLRAYDDMLLTDEHTWARWYYSVDDPQFIWARNKPIEADRLAGRLRAGALEALAGRVASDGPSVVVFNHACWDRTDVVKMERSTLPERFDIVDAEDGEALPWQQMEDGTVAFVARGVPALGYKRFAVRPREAAQAYEASVAAGADFIENRFFRVTLDAAGAIRSIVDKRHGGKELVDALDTHGMNQFVYYTSKKDLFVNPVYSEDCVSSAVVTSSAGCVLGTLTAEGSAPGADSIRRTVILYGEIDRIDIVNEVVKGEAPPEYREVCEEGFFTFPFNMQDFTIRHETPNGEIRPHVDSDVNTPTDQLYWTNTDFYTVNRWIDISNGKDYGVTFCAPDAPLVQYGGRRTSCWDKDYEIARPWVYSWLYTNLWSTCYPFTQPGPTVFRYSIRTHASPGWQAGRADKAGFEAANALAAVAAAGAQAGPPRGAKGRFLSLDSDNVRLTAAKPAEANGEGLILRFHETLGVDASAALDLSGLLAPEEAWETDIVENDRERLRLEGGVLRFRIPARGWKTIRVKGGEAPGKVRGLSASIGGTGTLVAWDAPAGADASHYEVFRGVSAEFEAGPGNYVATVSCCRYFDRQVASGAANDYYYKVRAAGVGRKGEASAAAKALPAAPAAQEPPPAVLGLRAEPLGNHRVSLSWEPPVCAEAEGYRIFRDGKAIADVPRSMTSWLDTGLKAGTKYAYSVLALGEGGAASPPGRAAEAVTPRYRIPGNIAPDAAATASSERGAAYSAQNVTDGVYGVAGVGEWEPAEEREPWVKLAWPTRRSIRRVHLFGRYDPGERVIFGINADNTINGKLVFSDGSFLDVGGVRCDGSATVVRFDEKRVTWVKFVVISCGAARPGLAEIEVF